MKKSILIVFFLFISGYLVAQDVHYSQFYAAPLSLNPSNAGLIKGKFRVGLNSKSQWSSVTKPYQNISAYFDMQYLKRKYRKDAFGIGVVLDADIAGDSKFSTISTGVALSYIKSFSRKNNNFFSVGLMPSLVQRSINFSKLYYDNQYNGSQYDPTIDPGEQFNRRNFLYFDLAVGMQWYYQFSRKTIYNAGLTISHITRPKMSFMDNKEIKLDAKYTLYGQASYSVGNDLDLNPSMLLSFQGPYAEVILGTLLKYNRSTQYRNYTAINLGLYMRYADALIVVAGFDYYNINFGVSYDINLSRLKPASKVRGGFELSVNYIFNRNKYVRKKETPCPIF
ncbi:MAG: PorP/SprF family type IX secretion system membrane protein [Bacteroidota bacterium]